MLDKITKDVLIKIFGYLDTDALKVTLLSHYFRDYFSINKNYICDRIFHNNGETIDLRYSYMVYKSIVHYGIRLQYDLSNNFENYEETYNIIDRYLYESISDLLISDVENAIDISINIIKFTLKDFIDGHIKERVYPSLIFSLMELLITCNIKTIDTNKKIKIIHYLISEYFIGIDSFMGIYEDNIDYSTNIDIDILWYLLENNCIYLDDHTTVKNILINKLFPYDERIYILRDEYRIDVILYLEYFEESILNLIYNGESNVLIKIATEFEIDLNDDEFLDTINDSNDINFLFELWKSEIMHVDFGWEILNNIYNKTTIDFTNNEIVNAIINYQEINISHNNSSLLYDAILAKDLKTIKFLVNKGINLDEYAFSVNLHIQGYPLDYAVCVNNIETVKYLVNCGAVKNAYILENICLTNSLEVLQYIVEESGVIYNIDDYCIIISYKYGYVELCTYLLEKRIFDDLDKIIEYIKYIIVYKSYNISKQLRQNRKYILNLIFSKKP